MKKGGQLWQRFAVALILTSAMVSAVAAAPPVPIVKSEFIFEKAPFPSCHASTIAETKSCLVAAWFGGTAERNPDVCIYVSRYLHGAWSEPVNIRWQTRWSKRQKSKA